MASPQRQRRALTMVEVLVIIAILALLFALLFPAIMRMRLYAAQLEDVEQLRRLGKAWLLYAQVNQGKTLKHKSGDPEFDRWIKKLSPYSDNIESFLVSPGDPNRQARLQYMERNPGRRTSSFVLNPYFATRMDDPATGRVNVHCEKLSECTNLAGAIAILPVSTEAGVPGSGYIQPQSWLAGPPQLAWKRTTAAFGIQPDRFLSTSSVDKSLGSSNYFFADGHVETVDAERIKTWINQNKNFLIPEK